MSDIEKLKIANILKPYPDIEFALLFGSYASGREHQLSDVDIALYLSEEMDIFTQGRLIVDLEIALEKKVDLVILNGLHLSSSKLAYNIYLHHQIILNRNPQSYEEFKFNALKYYMDLQHLYKMSDDALKERISNGTLAQTQTA
ncbi:MAG: nucleotidyltransferase domain-containing protein [Campylobacterales bacterium]|nr:nucleotidyltransferase domain-containing protein [Campylobacterales bacterium]